MVYNWAIFIRFFTIQIISLRPTKYHWHHQWYWMVIPVLNGIPFVYLFSFKIPLRPDKYWMVLQVLNDISFVIIQNTILRPTHYRWNWMVLNGIERYQNIISKLDHHCSPHWYWTVLQVFNGIPFVGYFTIQSTIDTNKFTFYVFDGIERYWTVLNGIERYWTVLNGIERYWTVLNGIERYWTVLNGIELYLNGIPLAGFDNNLLY